MEIIRDMEPAERQKAFVATFIRHAADDSTLNRLMVQEGKTPSWRLDYILDTHLSGLVEQMNRVLGRKLDPHSYYVLTGAGAFVFSMEHVCERLFGVKPREQAFVDEHIRIVSGCLTRLWQEPAKTGDDVA